MLQQDPSAHVYWESLIAEAKRPRAQNWCCLYRPRRGMPHTLIGYALSLICMFLIWLATLKASLSCPGQAVSLQKTLLHMYTLVVCPILCVVASSSQCHSATAHVASHRGRTTLSWHGPEIQNTIKFLAKEDSSPCVCLSRGPNVLTCYKACFWQLLDRLTWASVAS